MMSSPVNQPVNQIEASSPRQSIRRTRRVLLACDYYIHETHQGIVGYAKQAGWIIDSRVLNHGLLPAEWKADGILTFIGSNDRFGPVLRASKLPMVNMSPWRPELQIPTVVPNNREVGRLACEHLISHGLSHLAMVQFEPGSITGAARREGFEGAARAAGKTFHSLIASPSGSNGLRESLPRIGKAITGLPRPLGIFTEGDMWAVEIIYLCQQIGLKVPEDIAVIGVDNDPLVVDASPVSVSSVDNNLYALGYQAAALLDRLMNGEPPPTQPILVPPIGVAQRSSTSTIAATHDEVVAALKFIEAHFRDPITVADVANDLTISRRRLQDLFLRQVGQTVSEHITRHRLNLAKQMLHETQMKAGAIAERSGFGSHARMAKAFARVLATTPSQFRQDRLGRSVNRQ